MKYGVTLIFLFSFVSCEGRRGNCFNRTSLNSVTIDKRCKQFYDEMWDEADKTGACDLKPAITVAYNREAYVTWDKCWALQSSAIEKCRALPHDHNSREVLSGTTIFKDGKPVLVNGEPVNREPCK